MQAVETNFQTQTCRGTGIIKVHDTERLLYQPQLILETAGQASIWI